MPVWVQIAAACAAFAALVGLGVWKSALDEKAWRAFAAAHGMTAREIEDPYDTGLALTGAWRQTPVVLELRSTKSLSDPEGAKPSETRTKQTYSIFEIETPARVPELWLRRRHGALERLAGLDDTEEVPTGVAEIDADFTFRGKEPGPIRELLTDETWRDALLDLLRAAEAVVRSPAVYLREGRAKLVCRYRIRDHAKLTELLDGITACGRRLRGG